MRYFLWWYFSSQMIWVFYQLFYPLLNRLAKRFEIVCCLDLFIRTVNSHTGSLEGVSHTKIVTWYFIKMETKSFRWKQINKLCLNCIALDPKYKPHQLIFFPQCSANAFTYFELWLKYPNTFCGHCILHKKRCIFTGITNVENHVFDKEIAWFTQSKSIICCVILFCYTNNLLYFIFIYQKYFEVFNT